ncbi:MAG: hypothetical protein ACIAQU_05175, partial [Phycisphaerales bacterium JB064]
MQKLLALLFAPACVVVLATHASAQWDITFLHPDGASVSYCSAVTEGRQVGYAASPDLRAIVWMGDASSGVDLTPAGAVRANATSVAGAKVGGNYSIDGSTFRAALLAGVPVSELDLHPAEAESSTIAGMDEDTQAGSVYLPGMFPDSQACLWRGSADTYVNLAPAGSDTSSAYDAHGDIQVGRAAFGGVDLPVIWMGTAESWSSLLPAGGTSGIVWGVHGDGQAGQVKVDGVDRASLWQCSPGSWMDLHPDAAGGSVAFALTDGWQVGEARIAGDPHASVWRGTADSWEDLHDTLPIEFRFSRAQSVWSDGRSVRIGGVAIRPDGTSEAVLWSRELACRADLDGDGALTIFDFLAFQNAFDAGEAIADFDGDGELTI